MSPPLRRAAAIAVVALAVVATPGVLRAQERDAPVVAPIPGESAATAVQRAIVERWARIAAFRVRHGEQHRDVLRERFELAVLERDLLEAEMASAAAIDRPRVLDWIRAQIADVDARLAELSVSCRSGHPDVGTAQARRAALVEAQRAIEARGRFTPPAAPDPPGPLL